MLMILQLPAALTSHTGITIRSGTASKGAIYFSDGTSGNSEYRGYIEYNHQSDHLRFGTAAAEKVRIDSSGNMGVGNPSPAYKLSVLTTGTTDTSLHLATTGGASDNGDATNSIRFTGGNNTRWANAKYEPLLIYFMVMVLKMRVSTALGDLVSQQQLQLLGRQHQ